VKSSSQLREAMAELREELDAIVAVSEREERDLSEEESTRCSEISEKLIPTLNKQMKTALSIEKERCQRMESRTLERIEETRSDSGRVDASADKNMTRFRVNQDPSQGQTARAVESLHWTRCGQKRIYRRSGDSCWIVRQ
jgi:gas vesicle protein